MSEHTAPAAATEGAAEAGQTISANAAPAVAPEGAKVTRIPGVQFEVAPGKEVIVRVPGADQSYRGRIIGYDPYEYIVAGVRLPPSLRQSLAMGGQIVLKYVHKGTVYGFKTDVLNAVASPAQVLFFRYPDTIEKLDLRRSDRHHCNIDALLHGSSDEVRCMVVNVSECGCKISARAGQRDLVSAAKVDDALVVDMNLGADGVVKAAVAVKNISVKKGVASLGCMFLEISKQEMDTVRSYLDKIARLTR